MATPESIEAIRQSFRGFKEKVAADPLFSSGVTRGFLQAFVDDYVDRSVQKFLKEDGPKSPEEIADAKKALGRVVMDILQEEFDIELQRTDNLLAEASSAEGRREGFRFEINGVEIAGPPSDETIAAGLKGLPGGDPSFAILSESSMTYMQVGGSSEEGFVLEYQEGSIDRHYRSENESLDLSTATRVMQLYLRGDERWRTEVSWMRFTL